jgi:hypothetical protein
MQAHLVPDPVWAMIRFPVFARDVLLYKPGAFRMEATVLARCASADEEVWMRLAAIPPSIKEIGVGQVEGIDVAHQLLAFRSRDGVFLS